MRIAQIGPYPLSSECVKGGIESSVYGTSYALAQSHLVEVFDFPRQNGAENEERAQNLIIHRYQNSGFHNQDAAKRAKDIARDIAHFHPDICHLHGTGAFSAAIYNELINHGLRVILTIHGLAHIEKRNKLRKQPSIKHFYQFIRQSRIEFNLISQLDKVIVDTEYVASQLQTCYDKGKIKHLPEIKVIPQGIDESFFKLKGDKTGMTILSVGAFAERKGHLLLIKSFEEVCKVLPEARLVIAGTIAEPSYYHQILDYIGQSRQKDGIQLFPDIPFDELKHLYTQARIFALHSEEESQGISLVEAMAAGLPVVSTKRGGIPFIVKNGDTGLLTKYGDIMGFSRALVSLLSNATYWEKLACDAKEVAKPYLWRNISTEILRAYSTSVSNSSLSQNH